MKTWLKAANLVHSCHGREVTSPKILIGENCQGHSHKNYGYAIYIVDF